MYLYFCAVTKQGQFPDMYAVTVRVLGSSRVLLSPALAADKKPGDDSGGNVTLLRGRLNGPKLCECSLVLGVSGLAFPGLVEGEKTK